MVFTEESAVENFIIEKLVEKGWKFVSAEDLERESYQEPIFLKNFFKLIRNINDIALTVGDLNKIYIELNSRSSGVEGARAILEFLKQGIAIKLEKTKELKYIKLIDFKNIEKNEYIVTRQITFESSVDKRIPDIVLFVNGIPLVIIECKNPTDPSVSWKDAYNQINDYKKTIPELFKYVQFGLAAEIECKYFPIVPELQDAPVSTWRVGELDELEATLEMLTPETLLDCIKNYIFIREERGKTTKVMTRYMQYRAANKIYDRVIENLQEKETKNKGLIWHWQGSGKTLTMIFACHKLYRDEILENPTIFFILDRQELEEQMRQEFSALDLGIKPEVVSSIDELKEILRHDGGKGKRGIFITLIHKFQKKELDELEKELRENKDDETIIKRKNIICFIDEGHRTQYGVLAAQMRSILENAFFFAFTGTPIAKEGRDTYTVFSYPPKENYLDKYFILDSIKDGFTIPIRFQGRLEKDVHVDKANLEGFLEEEFEEIPEEFHKGVEDRIQRRLNSIKVFMKNPKRIKMIVGDIAKHFQENIENKFKAMVVAVDRHSCVLYKKELDKLLPAEYSEIVMTYTKKDSEEIKSYLKDLQKRYHGKDTEDIRKEVIEKYKEQDNPKILIVTDMLLTGFDAPILQTMYFDKPLKEHRLLQAVARVNRPFQDKKEAGLILDYIGIFDKLDKALKAYSKDDVQGVLLNIEEEKKEFVQILSKTLAFFNGIDRTKDDRPTIIKAISKIIENKEITKEFEKNFKILRKKFELLGPDPIKVRYFDEFMWLSRIYYAYLRHVRRVDPDEEDRYVKKYFARTLKYIHETIEIDRLRKDFPMFAIDIEYLKKLEKLSSSVEDKISDMTFALKKFILVERTRSPVYETILEKVERIIKERNEKLKSNEAVYDELKKIVNQINEMNKRKNELGMKDAEYSTLLLLEDVLGKNETLTNEVRSIFEEIFPKMFKGWSLKKSAIKDIGVIIRKKIRKYEIPSENLDEIYGKIIGTLKKFD